jgi:hypothetical protein
MLREVTRMRNFLVSSALATLVASTQIALAARLSAVWSVAAPVCGQGAKPMAGAAADPRLAVMAHCADDAGQMLPSRQLHRVSTRAR